MHEHAPRWRPIGAVLLSQGLINEVDLEEALEEQKRSGRRLGEILIDSGRISWLALAEAIAEQAKDLDAAQQGHPVAPAPAPTFEPPVTEEATVPVAAVPQPARVGVEVAAENRLQTVETMLKERQRAFLELVSTTETLRRSVAKLQEQIALKDEEISRLRRQISAQLVEPAAAQSSL